MTSRRELERRLEAIESDEDDDPATLAEVLSAPDDFESERENDLEDEDKP